MIEIGDWTMPWGLFWITTAHVCLAIFNWESWRIWMAIAGRAAQRQAEGAALQASISRQLAHVKELLADNDAALARLKHQEANMHELHEAIREDLARLEQRRLELQPFWRFP